MDPMCAKNPWAIAEYTVVYNSNYMRMKSRAVLDAPRTNASWEVCRFRGGPGCGPNVCPEPVGYYSSTAVYGSFFFSVTPGTS